MNILGIGSLKNDVYLSGNMMLHKNYAGREVKAGDELIIGREVVYVHYAAKHINGVWIGVQRGMRETCCQSHKAGDMYYILND